MNVMLNVDSPSLYVGALFAFGLRRRRREGGGLGETAAGKDAGGRAVGGPKAAGTSEKAGGRRGAVLRRGKEASPARRSYTDAVPPITSGIAKWPPFPAKLDHRGPMHETLACLWKSDGTSHLPNSPPPVPLH